MKDDSKDIMVVDQHVQVYRSFGVNSKTHNKNRAIYIFGTVPAGVGSSVRVTLENILFDQKVTFTLSEFEEILDAWPVLMKEFRDRCGIVEMAVKDKIHTRYYSIKGD